MQKQSIQEHPGCAQHGQRQCNVVRFVVVSLHLVRSSARLAAPPTGRRVPRLRWHIQPYYRCGDRTARDNRAIGARAPGAVDSAGANDRVCFAYDAECRQDDQESSGYFDNCQLLYLGKSQKMNA